MTSMEAPTRNATVLLVDDDDDFLFQHKALLERAGFSVTTAGSLREAEATEERPDVAVLDLMMENADDGFVLSYRLKKRFPGLPIIVVTAVTSETGMMFDPTSPQERAWVSADKVLSKPIRFEQLLSEIERLLGATESR
jgi:CheY-like chemotaxis protein